MACFYIKIAALKIKFILLQWIYSRNTIWGRKCVTHYFDKILVKYDGWTTFSMHEIYINLFLLRKTTLFHVLSFWRKTYKWYQGPNTTKEEDVLKVLHIKYVGVIYNICWIPGKLWQGTKVDCNLLLCYANDNKHSRMGTKHNVYDL